MTDSWSTASKRSSTTGRRHSSGSRSSPQSTSATSSSSTASSTSPSPTASATHTPSWVCRRYWPYFQAFVIRVKSGFFQLAHSYRGSRVLILGGGDGGLLKELLDLGENKPEFVTMVEIDPLVLEACSKHLPGVCGPYLRQRSGANFEILCDDAVQKMETYKVSTMTDCLFSRTNGL